MTEEHKTALEPRPDAPAAWRSREDVAALAARLQTMLPGHKLNREESLLLAQYAAAMDANPYRGEIYAYTQRGKLVLVEGYKLLVRWATRQSQFTARYEAIPPEDLDDNAIGYRCYILRHDHLDAVRTLTDAGAPWTAAVARIETSAVGIVTQADRTTKKGQSMDPPTGWTWDQVAEKRALKNAINRAFGAPSPKELARESWMVGDTETTPEDWELVAENIAPCAGPDERARVAQMIHEQREAGERVHNPDTAIPTGRQNRHKHQLFKGETTDEATARRLELLNGGFPEGAIPEL